MLLTNMDAIFWVGNPFWVKDEVVKFWAPSILGYGTPVGLILATITCIPQVGLRTQISNSLCSE